MKVLSIEEFYELIEAGYESRRTEFKPPFSWKDLRTIWLREKVIQTILGLANTPDGGDIIIGIKENVGKKIVLKGLTKKQMNSYIYDDIKGVVDGFASPSVNFDIAQAEYQRRWFIVFRVAEFDDIPIICRRNGRNTNLLSRGDIYTRSRSGPAATIRVTETEMREIIDLTVAKKQVKVTHRYRKYMQQKKDEEFFIKQRKEF